MLRLQDPAIKWFALMGLGMSMVTAGHARAQEVTIPAFPQETLMPDSSQGATVETHEKWVTITRPMLACYTAGGQYAEAQAQLWSNIRSWSAGSHYEGACEELQKGDQYEIGSEVNGAIELIGWCYPHCNPSGVSYFAPSRKLAGNYFKSSRPPPAFIRWIHRK